MHEGIRILGVRCCNCVRMGFEVWLMNVYETSRFMILGNKYSTAQYTVRALMFAFIAIILV